MILCNNSLSLGGASGIGLETSRVLALRGARVIIAARNIEAAKEAKKAILDQCETAKVDTLKLDLCSMKSIVSFAKSFNDLDLPLNILMCERSSALSLSSYLLDHKQHLESN